VDIFLPITMKKFNVENRPTSPPPPQWSVVSELGIPDDMGQFTPGTAFQYGHLVLCQRITWSDLPVGTPIRWQWYVDEEAVAPDDTDLNRTFEVPDTSGVDGNCVEYRNQETGEQLPLPLATYRVDVWVDDVGEAAPRHTFSEAVIQEDPPEGATAIPPTPTPAPTRPPGTFTCRQIMVNGDFEQGAEVGWAVDSNAEVGGEPLGPQHVIRNNDEWPDSDPAFEGDWFALLGDDPDFDLRMILFQETATDLVDPAKIITAELRYYAGQATDEVRDGTNNDNFGVVVINQDNQAEIVPNTVFSEETLEAGRWYSWRVPVTELLTQRESWTTVRFGFVSEINDNTATVHFLDSTRLDVCEAVTAADAAVLRAGASATGVRVTPAQPLPAGLRRGGAPLEVSALGRAFGGEIFLPSWQQAFDLR
jgi:hypothetical protein